MEQKLQKMMKKYPLFIGVGFSVELPTFEKPTFFVFYRVVQLANIYLDLNRLNQYIRMYARNGYPKPNKWKQRIG